MGAIAPSEISLKILDCLKIVEIFFLLKNFCYQFQI